RSGHATAQQCQREQQCNERNQALHGFPFEKCAHRYRCAGNPSRQVGLTPDLIRGSPTTFVAEDVGLSPKTSAQCILALGFTSLSINLHREPSLRVQKSRGCPRLFVSMQDVNLTQGQPASSLPRRNPRPPSRCLRRPRCGGMTAPWPWLSPARRRR